MGDANHPFPDSYILEEDKTQVHRHGLQVVGINQSYRLYDIHETV